MKKPIVALVVALVVTATTGIGWALFERHERGGLKQAAEKPCTGLVTPAPGTPRELPLGIPLTAGESILRVTTQGKTTIAFGTLPGTRDDIVTVRDQVLADLAGKGYTVVGTDQEPGFEAEAELAGTHRGTVQVTPLCQDVLQIRYKINE